MALRKKPSLIQETQPEKFVPVTPRFNPPVTTLEPKEENKEESFNKCLKDKLYFMWIKDNQEFIETDKRKEIESFYSLLKDKEQESKNIDWFYNKLNQTIFRILEGRTFNTSEQYLYDKYGFDFIEAISTSIHHKLIMRETPINVKPS